MDFEKLEEDQSVTDKERTSFGVGHVKEIKDNTVTVWYDEVEKLVMYKEEEVKFFGGTLNEIRYRGVK